MTLLVPQLKVRNKMARIKDTFFILITNCKDNRNYCVLIYLWYYYCYVYMEEKDFYITDEGYKCFTEKYHLKRGYCCKSNCKHCPYGYNPNID